MTDIELKKLSRSDLLEMLIAAEKENESLRQELEQAKAAVETREIILADAGNIAEASLKLNDVFAAAQNAAAQYLENIQRMSQNADARIALVEAEAKQKSNDLLISTQAKCKLMEQESSMRASAMLENAKIESEAYWQKTYSNLEQYMAVHNELAELLKNTGFGAAYEQGKQ